MWKLVCLHYLYRRTYRREFRPTDLDGIVALLDGYDDPLWLDTVIRLNLFEEGKLNK